MAFVAVLPAILPALGTMASALPVVGGSIGAGLTGLGGALGAGSLGAAGTALAGIPSAMAGAFGSGAAGGMLGSGLGGLYGGADALLGGMLPNMGVAGTVTPGAGYLGSGGLGLFGGGAPAGTTVAPQFGGYGGAMQSFAPGAGPLVPSAGGGFMGAGFDGLMGGLGTLGEVGGVLNMMRGGGGVAPAGVTATGINTRPVNEEKDDGIKQNGGQVGNTSSLNLSPAANYSPMAPGANGGGLQYNNALAMGLGSGGLIDLIQNMQEQEETHNATGRSLGAVYGSRPTTMV